LGDVGSLGYWSIVMVAKSHLGLGVVALLAGAGCTPMARVDPVEVSAEGATGLRSAFVFRNEGEETDVDAGAGEVLTFEQAVRWGLEHSPRIQAAIARLRQAEAEARQQRLLPNPVMSVSMRLPEGGGPGIVDLSLSGQLLSLIQRPGMIAVADHRLRVAAAEALVVVLEEVTEVRKEYLRAQSLDARIESANVQAGLLDELAAVAGLRVEEGEASQLDALTIDAERATVATDLIELRAERRTCRLALAKSIGNPSGGSEWRLERWQPPVVRTVGVEEWISVGLQSRPEIQAAVWRLRALGEQVELARLSPLDGAEAGATAERDGGWSVGPAVAFPVPALDWGQAKRALAMAQRVEARHEMTEVRRSVVKEVRQAAASVAAAEEAMRSVRERLIPLQESRREQAENAYRLGLADVTAVRLAERDLEAARSRLIDFQRKVSEAVADLERAVGGSGVAARVSSAAEPVTTQPRTTTPPTSRPLAEPAK
jgi:cobalt-zinc-cadmium efflux system outer membrane protein